MSFVSIKGELQTWRREKVSEEYFGEGDAVWDTKDSFSVSFS